MVLVAMQKRSGGSSSYTPKAKLKPIAGNYSTAKSFPVGANERFFVIEIAVLICEIHHINWRC